MDHFCYLCFTFVCHTVLSVPCSRVVTCLERTALLTLLHVMFFCVLVIFLYGVLGKVWYLIVSILDLRFLLFFGWVCLCFLHAQNQVSWSFSDHTDYTYSNYVYVGLQFSFCPPTHRSFCKVFVPLYLEK